MDYLPQIKTQPNRKKTKTKNTQWIHISETIKNDVKNPFYKYHKLLIIV